MIDKEYIYNTISEQFGSDNFLFRNVELEVQRDFFRAKYQSYDLIVFNPKRVIFLVSTDTGEVMGDPALFVRSSLNHLANKLAISINNVIACGISNDQLFFFNKYNDRMLFFEATDEGFCNFLELIDNELLYGNDIFDYVAMQKLSDTLILTSDSKKFSGLKEKTKTTADGTVYVRKHGTWLAASEIDPNFLYTLTALAGMFGFHLFYQKKIAKGLLYLFTGGLFGIGWLIDCFEIFVGIYKDPDGRYLTPISSKAFGLVLVLAGGVILLLFSFIVKLFISVFSGSFSCIC